MEQIFSTPEFWLAARLVWALILGGVLGLERTLAGKSAGLRTYGLVSLGAALFVVVSQLVLREYGSAANFDPLRVASQVVVGIGFLGTGLILFVGGEPRRGGLTTAAGLWVAAGIGLACGFGFYILAAAATLLVLFTFVVLWFLENWFHKTERPE